MDPDLNKEVLDVRKVIEKSTSKVSLRDLEKKGFRQVKVLRAGDINQLIFKAVQNVLAKSPRGGMSEAEREQIAKEAKAELDAQMAQMREMQAESQRIEEAHKNLEAKLAEVNKQLQTEKAAVVRDRQAFQQERQQLFDKGMAGQQAAEQKYVGQLEELRERLMQAESRAQTAEAKARGAEGAVPRQEHEQALARVRAEMQELETRGQRYRRHADELEESEAKLRTRAASLEEEVARLRHEVEELAASQARGSGMGQVDPAEMQRMRMEMDQRDAKMKEMFQGLVGTLTLAKNAPQDPADLQKHFKSLQQGLQDQLRKMAGTGAKGGYSEFELTAEAAAAIFAEQDQIKVETNIKDIAVKEQSAAGVKDKLSKLKNLRGGNK
jgi:chromosome segregation ATPase